MIILESSSHMSSECQFSGVAISEKAIVRTKAGFQEYLGDGGEPSDFCSGKYACSYWVNDKEKLVEADSEGQELIFYYKDCDFWAYSNSFFVLIWYLRKKSRELNLSIESLAQILVRGVAFDQPISEELPVNKVFLLNKDEKIRATKETIDVHKYRKEDEGSLGFLEAASKFVEFNRRLVASVLDCGAPVNLELSGGLDSRVLASINACYASHDNFGFISQKSKPEDYIIAKQLVRAICQSDILPAKNKVNSISLSEDRRWLAFLAGNIGVCQTVKNLPGSPIMKPTFRINGGGGEMGKAVFGSSLSPFLKTIEKSNIASELKEKLQGRFEKTVSSYSSNIQEGLVKFYRDYRFRYFVGKGWYRDFSLLTISPFTSMAYSSLVDAEDIEGFFGKSKDYIFSNNLIYLYLINKTFPSLAYFISDTKDKCFDVNDIFLVENLPSIRSESGPPVGKLAVYGTLLDSIDINEQVNIAEYSLESLLDFVRPFDNPSRYFKATVDKYWPDIKNLGILDKVEEKKIAFDLANCEVEPNVLLNLFHVAVMIKLTSPGVS